MKRRGRNRGSGRVEYLNLDQKEFGWGRRGIDAGWFGVEGRYTKGNAETS